MSEISGGNDSMDETGGTETGAGAETAEAVGDVSVSAEAAVPSDSVSEISSSGTEGLLAGHEISINPSETAHGMNQILETPETLELAHAQAQIEGVHQSTLASILERDGAHISEQDHARIEAGLTSLKAVDNLTPGKTGG